MKGRELQGIVRSDKMKKTVVVEVTRQTLHPVFKKYVRKSKRYLVDDPASQAHVGDHVRIVETRPLSARKRFRLLEVVTPAARHEETPKEESPA